VDAVPCPAVGASLTSNALVGAVAKESADDVKAMREYNETVAKGRGGLWKEFHAAAKAKLK